MGCSAGVIAIGLAQRVLRTESGKYALVVSTENVTQNWCVRVMSSLVIVCACVCRAHRVGQIRAHRVDGERDAELVRVFVVSS